MADDFFKGLGRYIPPEIRRFSPAIKTVADILRPTQIVKNPAVSNLVRSPSLANLGTVLSNTAMTAAEVIPGGKLVTTPVKKTSKLVDDLIKSKQVKKASELTQDPLNLMSIKRDRFGRIIEAKNQSKGEGYSLSEVIKDPTTPLNKALLEIGDEKIATMTNRELTDYMNKVYPNLNVKYGTIALKKLKTLSDKNLGGQGTKKQNLKDAFDSIDNPEQYSFSELLKLPVIKKAMKENNINRYLFTKYKNEFGITQSKSTPRFFDNVNLNEEDVVNYIKENPTVTIGQIKTKFPKLKDVSSQTIQTWRSKHPSDLVRVNAPSKNQKVILEDTNPKLQEKLDFIPEGSTTPIKHKDAFSEVITINKKSGPLNVVRTKIVQAHGIGEGGISKASEEIIKSKVAMIPEKFLQDEKLPKFFLTKSGNTAHRDIENNLILSLVKKYKTLGYEFVDDTWKQTRKVNPKSVSKELKDLENEIISYQDELKDLDAYTLFYNPVKDKMVTHGKPLSEIPGLGNLLNKVKSGEKKLRYGGLVGISHLTRPL